MSTRTECSPIPSVIMRVIKYLSPFDSEWPKEVRITVLIASLMLLSALDRILVKIQVTVGIKPTKGWFSPAMESES